MDQLLLASFSDPVDADHAVEHLHLLEYGPENISIITKGDPQAVSQLMGEGHPKSSTMWQGLVLGAITGGPIGMFIGLLVGSGIAPSLGALLFGGKIAAAFGFSGMVATIVSGAVSGLLVGGILGALASIGLEATDSESYQSAINKGEVLLGVALRAEDEDELRAIMAEYGGEHVRLTAPVEPESEALDADWQNSDLGFAPPAVVAFRKDGIKHIDGLEARDTQPPREDNAERER